MAVIALHPAARPQRELLKPPIVFAPSPVDPSQSISLRISENALAELARAARRTDVFAAWAHLVGEMPPVNNAYHYPQTVFPNPRFRSLKDAHACFKGVRRPLGVEDSGEEVLIYVLSTPHTVRWKADPACVVAIADAPADTVLAVQVRSANALQLDSGDVWGAISKWEFVNADADQPSLPIDHAKRYDSLLWQR